MFVGSRQYGYFFYRAKPIMCINDLLGIAHVVAYIDSDTQDDGK
jgi:hypothetical protein